MHQADRSQKSIHGHFAKVFSCLSILGIITTIWIVHQATTKYERIENKTLNIENSMKAKMKDFNLTTVLKDTLFRCILDCVFLNDTNVKSMVTRKTKMKDFTLTTALRDTLFQCILDCDFLKDTNEKSMVTKKRNLSPTIYVITPTFRRPEQIPELTRLGQTLRQVENIHWIVAEDARVFTPAVKTTIEKMGIPYTILLAPMPEKHASEPGLRPKGVSNRMAAIEWLRSNNITRGVMYFADDDNTYDLELFEEIRRVKKVGMWPVGLVSHFGVNSPIVKCGKVVGFYVGWIGHRTFPIDMAGFGVNLDYLSKFPNVTMPFWHGYEETVFLAGLNIINDDIEPLADNCTKILVWHTQTIKNDMADKTQGQLYYGTNIPFLLDQIQ